MTNPHASPKTTPWPWWVRLGIGAVLASFLVMGVEAWLISMWTFDLG
jgi:hypothetical protein